MQDVYTCGDRKRQQIKQRCGLDELETQRTEEPQRLLSFTLDTGYLTEPGEPGEPPHDLRHQERPPQVYTRGGGGAGVGC